MVTPKERLRGDIKNRLKTVSPGERALQGEQAAAMIRASSLWAEYGTVFLFLSIKDEIDTRFLLEAALADGKRVFAPGTVPVPKSPLVFYPVFSAAGPWRKGAFGIREPIGGVSEAAADFPALIVTPGLAFDPAGSRLGRGGGYYDRFFAEMDARNRRYFALGFCMDFQLLEKVPAGENDKKVNAIAAGSKLITSHRGNKGAPYA